MKTPPELMAVSPSMEAREARGLTRQELANEQHVSVQFVWLVEKLEANLLFRECFKHFLEDLSIPGDHTYGYCLFRLTPTTERPERRPTCAPRRARSASGPACR